MKMYRSRVSFISECWEASKRQILHRFSPQFRVLRVILRINHDGLQWRLLSKTKAVYGSFSLFCNTEIDGGRIFPDVRTPRYDHPSGMEAPGAPERKAAPSSRPRSVLTLESASQDRLDPRGDCHHMASWKVV